MLDPLSIFPQDLAHHAQYVSFGFPPQIIDGDQIPCPRIVVEVGTTQGTCGLDQEGVIFSWTEIAAQFDTHEGASTILLQFDLVDGTCPEAPDPYRITGSQSSHVLESDLEYQIGSGRELSQVKGECPDQRQ